MRPLHPIVFLVDVDNTLLDNDGIQQDLQDHLERVFGLASRERYWTIQEDLFAELGYRDYIGALHRYRDEHPRDVVFQPRKVERAGLSDAVDGRVLIYIHRRRRWMT